MRKWIALILVAALAAGIACAAGETPELTGDWKMSYEMGGIALGDQTIFIYEDGTFEAMDDAGTHKGTWRLDGEELVLTDGEDDVVMAWDADAQHWIVDMSGMIMTLARAIEPEGGDVDSGAEEGAEIPGGILAGGWAAADDWTVTDEIRGLLDQGMDSYQTGTITVVYTPAALLGSQVVAGTNYAVLCRASEINEAPYWVVVYLYQDLEGGVSVLKIDNVVLGI